MSAVLNQSPEQRLVALEKANRIRCARAALKLAIRDRELDAWAVIDEPHQDYLTMRVYDLLLAVPKFGPTKARRLLLSHHVSQSKTLGGLSRRQRSELVAALRGPR